MASCAHVPPPKSQDSDLHRPMAWVPGAYDLRALSWAHVRVWVAAGRGCHTPAWPGSARFARSSYVNRALFGISTSADRWPQFWRCMPCVSYHGTQSCVGGVAEGCNTGPQRSISRIKHDLHRRSAQSAHSPAKPACGSRAQRLPRRAHVPRTGRAGHRVCQWEAGHRSVEVAVPNKARFT